MKNRLHTISRAAGLLLVLGLGFCVAHCDTTPEISNTDRRITLRDSVTYFNRKPYTGLIRQSIPAVQEVRTTPYVDGLPHGTMIARQSSGQVLARGEYIAGDKHGLHRTWYKSGNDRSYGEFERGKYVKDHWVWHKNGNVMQFDRYNSNHEIVVSKKWRTNGLIYMNLVFHDGADLGLPGSKVCNPTSQTPAKAAGKITAAGTGL